MWERDGEGQGRTITQFLIVNGILYTQLGTIHAVSNDIIIVVKCVRVHVYAWKYTRKNIGAYDIALCSRDCGPDINLVTHLSSSFPFYTVLPLNPVYTHRIFTS